MADELPEVWAFRDEVLGDSHPLTYEQALNYVDEDGQVGENPPSHREAQKPEREFGKDLRLESGGRRLVRAMQLLYPARPHRQR